MVVFFQNVLSFFCQAEAVEELEGNSAPPVPPPTVTVPDVTSPAATSSKGNYKKKKTDCFTVRQRQIISEALKNVQVSNDTINNAMANNPDFKGVYEYMVRKLGSRYAVNRSIRKSLKKTK